MNLTLIAAMGQNRVIGKNNDLIWKLPRDMRHFKELTTGHHVIMGRKTLESMNGKPLPKRTNIVITRQQGYTAEGCIVVNSLKEALGKVKDDEQPFVIGGAEIYKLALPKANTMELTLVHNTFAGDTYFPEFDSNQWLLEKEEKFPADEKNPYALTFQKFIKKT